MPATLAGQWVTSYSGWMHFEPGVVPVLKDESAKQPQHPPVDTYESFNKRAVNLPPLIGGYRYVPHFFMGRLGFPSMRLRDTFERREGYFAFAAITCLNFDGKGKLTGLTKFNRGGVDKTNLDGVGGLESHPLTGNYTTIVDADINAIIGNIETHHSNRGAQDERNEYAFIVRSDDELDWVWEKGSRRALVTQGQFRRITSRIR